jgi:hypothetical protein
VNDTYIDWDNAELDTALWQGIRFLSYDAPAPAFVPITVTVHLARPASGLSADDVAVEGGESITEIPHQITVTPGSDEIDIQFESRGDYSPYTIRLLDGGDDPLHPFFDRASFNFYIDCPLGDCRDPELEAERLIRKRPAIDLKTKDYKGFVRVLSDWIKVTNFQWADLSPASFERMMVELLSHHADFLSYYQDRVANEAFIDTASQRHSLRHHGALLGYELFDGRSAETVIAFDVTNAGVIPRGLAIDLKGAPGEMPLVYTTREAVRVDPRYNIGALIPAAWPGAVAAELPQGATGFLLWGHGHDLMPSQRLSFVQGPYVQIVTLALAEELSLPGWVADPGDPVAAAPADVTRIAWSEPTTAPIMPWAGDAPFQIRGNLSDADHGSPRRAAVPSAPGSGGDSLEMTLTRRNSIIVPRPLGDGPPSYLLRALKLPEMPVSFVDDGAGTAMPAIDVTFNDIAWSRQLHLWNSRSYDRHYVAEADDDGGLWLFFGDGDHGREIEVVADAAGVFRPIRSLMMDYRIGGPTAGNCARDTLNRIAVSLNLATVDMATVDAIGVTALTNVVPGAHGIGPETLDAARFSIPESLHHGPLERAVTLDDYATAAMMVEGVARAAALNLGGVFNTVLVLVDPTGQGDLPPALAEQVWQHLDRLRMTGREHFVAPPDYVALDVQLAVCAEPDMPRHRVRDRVLAALRPGTDERPGYFHPDLLSFGQDAELSDLLAHVQGLAGVRSVKALCFRRLDDASDTPLYDIVVMSPTEVARLDGNDNRPENGVLKVLMVGTDEIDEDKPPFEIAGPAAELGGGI